MKEIISQRDIDRRARASWRRRALKSGRTGERGAIAVMFVGLLILIFAFFGLALDLARVYNRKAEMQAVADAVAVSAAKKLDGTSSGISAAVQVAHNVLETGTPILRAKYAYNQTMVFSDAAIVFSKSADGSTGWLDEASAMAAPTGLHFVKVDTSKLDSSYGKVTMLFMPVISPTRTSVTVSRTSVASRGSSIGVTPLAICAMSDTKHDSRDNPGYKELREYGFRRGVSYDLMKLNKDDDLTAANYLVDPISPPGPGASNFDLATVGPHVCAGSVALPKVLEASVRVQSGFPISSLKDQLNSRFNLSNGKCDPATAPPDSNIRQYPRTAISWMTTVPGSQSAAGEVVSDNKLATVADLLIPQSPESYGPLWVFARAVPWDSYVSGEPEPANGYVPFPASTAVWTSLYSTGPGITGYPSGVSTPYRTQTTSPPATRPGRKYRRILNVPLLQCPVSGSTATVLAIGKFFMTVPADSSAIYAEFAGLNNDDPISGQVELSK